MVVTRKLQTKESYLLEEKNRGMEKNLGKVIPFEPEFGIYEFHFRASLLKDFYINEEGDIIASIGNLAYLLENTEDNTNKLKMALNEL